MACRTLVGIALIAAAISATAHAEPTPIAAVPHKESLALIAVIRGEGFTEKQGATIEELILGALDMSGKFKVIGRTDIDAVLSLEAKKESAGCTDTECAVRIAGALGVDLVATATVGRLGTNTLLSLKLIAVRSASVVARAQQTVQSDNDLPNAARALADEVVANRFGIPVAASAPAPPPARPAGMAWQRVLGWVGLAVGGAALLTGAGVGISSIAQQNEIHTTQRPGATALQIMNNSNSFAVGSDVSLIGGGVLAAGGTALVVVF